MHTGKRIFVDDLATGWTIHFVCSFGLVFAHSCLSFLAEHQGTVHLVRCTQDPLVGCIFISWLILPTSPSRKYPQRKYWGFYGIAA